MEFINISKTMTFHFMYCRYTNVVRRNGDFMVETSAKFEAFHLSKNRVHGWHTVVLLRNIDIKNKIDRNRNEFSIM